MTNRALLAGLLAFGLLVAALIVRSGDLALLTLPLLAYLAAGLLTAPDAGKLRLAASRSSVLTPESEDTTIEVSVAVRNDARDTVLLHLADPLPPGAALTEGAPELRAALAPGEETALGYTLRTSGAAAFAGTAWPSPRAIFSGSSSARSVSLRPPRSGCSRGAGGCSGCPSGPAIRSTRRAWSHPPRRQRDGLLGGA